MLFASKTCIFFTCLSFLSLSESAFGRGRWLEREDRPINLHPRRFGQERPAVIDKLAQACPGGICATLAGQAITPLLAAQPECSQQDMADLIIDTAQQFDTATRGNMIELAKEYRQAEKNTPPDFTTNPPTNRNSVFCQKAPKNAELDGLVQAQDPANDPDIFFDPATKASVRRGDQPNTFPFNSGNQGNQNRSPAPAVSGDIPPATPTNRNELDVLPTPAPTSTACSTATVRITTTPGPLPLGPVRTVTFGNSVPLIPAPTSTASAIGNFGSCTLPQIEFGPGFDGRTETSFQPADKDSFNHGSAQNIDIITQFMCDTLVNGCGADQAAQDTCARAKQAASSFPPKTGAQADAFNAVFGVPTDFRQVPAIDNQGNVIPGSTIDDVGDINGSAKPGLPGGGTPIASQTNGQAAPTANPINPSGSGGIGNFGRCTVPQIVFASGLDGRKETSFQAADLASFNHGSAQNIDIIADSICDTLVNGCGADQTAIDTCARARAAAGAQPAKTGAQADAFNAIFEIQTNFASVPAIDDQGRVVSGNSSGVSSPQGVVPVGTPAPAPAATSAPNNPTGQNFQTFTGALGGIIAPAVTQLTSGQFQVQGNTQFVNLNTARTRSCDVQHNLCADAANASGNQNALTVPACDTQQRQCTALIGNIF